MTFIRYKLRAKVHALDSEASDDSWDKVNAERRRLSCEITKWQEQYYMVAPQLCTSRSDNALSSEDIEDTTLGLPSEFDSSDRHAYGLHSLTTVELDLRKGEAYDAIREVRASASHVAGLKVQKKRHVRGVRNTTRANSVITTATRHLDHSAEEYNRSRIAILSLDPALGQDFPELTAKDYKIKGLEKGVFLGTGTVTEGWIWGFGSRSDQKMLTWQKDGLSDSVSLRYFFTAYRLTS